MSSRALSTRTALLALRARPAFESESGCFCSGGSSAPLARSRPRTTAGALPSEGARAAAISRSRTWPQGVVRMVISFSWAASGPSVSEMPTSKLSGMPAPGFSSGVLASRRDERPGNGRLQRVALFGLLRRHQHALGRAALGSEHHGLGRKIGQGIARVLQVSRD